uniref:Inner centromere protein ARK-binding domain-containing protein n=1 Tax=Cajanus cajan TaxID=3821 RepID=A0A151TPY9_CAJCA|nr:hypothetical protein KK1_008320 [Cajanus cajan]
MSAMEKHLVQIFEIKKRIIDQSRQQCHLWEHHLFPKLLLNGIPPPPWLCNSSLHADPQEFNKNDVVSDVLLSQPQCSVPFPGVYSNLDAVTYGVQYPIGLHNAGRALEKNCDARDRVSNLPDCSVNNVVCASSSGPPELDSVAVSPQNQIEARASDSHHDPALSLARVQRSKSRQRALELRNSAKALRRLSSCPPSGHDILMTGTSVMFIYKSAQSPQPITSQNLHDPMVSHVGSFSSQKDPDFCEVKRKERLSRSAYQIGCYKVFFKDSAEKENVAALAASGNTRAVTTCANEGSLRPVSSSNLDGRSLLAEVYVEAVVDEKVLDAQENIPSGAFPTDNAEHRPAAIVGEDNADSDELVEKDPPCASPKVGLNVSVSKMPADFMSVMPKKLDFDDVEETSMNGICSPDLNERQQGVSPEGPLNLLEPVNVLEKETSPVCRSKSNSLVEMPSLQMQEVLIAKEGPQMEYHSNHFKEEDIPRTKVSAKSLNHPSPSQVASENSSRSLSKEVMPTKFVSVDCKLKNDESSAKLADSSSEAVTGNDLHNYADENVASFTIGFPFSAPMDDVNVGLAQQVPKSIALCQDGDLLQQALLSNGKITGFSTGFQIFRSSTESFTYDVEHSCPQHKRRKIENEAEKFLPASSNLLEKPCYSIDQRPVSRNSEVALEVLHLPSDRQDDIGHHYICNSPTDEEQYNRECETMEDSSLKVRKEEKLILDGRDRIEDTLRLAVANPPGISIDSMMRCTMDEKEESCHHLVNCGQENSELETFVERSTSSTRIYPGENAKLSDGMFASPGMQCLDLVGTDEALPEFEGFIMQTVNAQPNITEDEMDLEKMNVPSNSIDYTSLGKSRFMHSPLCNSLTPYKLHNVPDIYQSLPNGLLEGLGVRSSIALSDTSPRSRSDCQPNCKGQYTSSVLTLRDRIYSNLGSSGKCKSLKLDLPCITEENENVDEIAGTFQRGIACEGMVGSNIRAPLAEIVDNENPSTSVLQDDILTGGHEDVVSTEFNLSGTCNKVKNKLDKQDGNRKRFTGKGKENHNISLGANGVKRATESVRKRPSRPKLSGKDIMKHGPINNIVSNVSSFIPLVQQKQAAAVVTGKRDIKVKALEAAEAAKRMAEKKENERKMKKEVMRLEREKLELELQKKKKEEERKKKEAQMAAKKRQREDEERKEKEKKRKRLNDIKKQQQEHEKIRAKKEEIEIEIQCRAMVK